MRCKMMRFKEERESVLIEGDQDGIYIVYRCRQIGRSDRDGNGFLPKGREPYVTVTQDGRAFCDGRLVARINGSGCCWSIRNGWEKPIAWVEAPSYPLSPAQKAASALALLVVPWI